jgi:hypothetical protein
LLATVGRPSTRCRASPGRPLPAAQLRRRAAPVDAVHARRLAEQQSMGISTGLRPNSLSSTRSCRSSVASPTTATGQRSRSQIAESAAGRPGHGEHIALLALVAPDLQRRHAADRRRGRRAGRKEPPQPPSLTSSGSALDRPPAPTSWMKAMGLCSPSCQQRSITSWQRRSISGFWRCTEAKSRVLLAVGTGHARRRAAAQADQHRRPAEHQQLRARARLGLLHVLRRDIAETAGDHDRLVIAAQAQRPSASRTLLVAAEIAAEIGAAEFVVEGRAADRPLEHDLQGRGTIRAGLPLSTSQGCSAPGMRRLDTLKPVSPPWVWNRGPPRPRHESRRRRRCRRPGTAQWPWDGCGSRPSSAGVRAGQRYAYSPCSVRREAARRCPSTTAALSE